jgi:hypothetical protein
MTKTIRMAAVTALLALCAIVFACGKTPERTTPEAGATAHHLGAAGRVPPYALLLVSRNGATPTSGPQNIAVNAGDVLTFSAGSSIGVTQWLWELIDYPPGMTLPTGWSWEGVPYASPMMYNLGFSPPAVTVPALATNNWGKISPRLTVNGNPQQYLPSGAQNTGFNPGRTDSSTLLYLPSAAGLEGIAFQEQGQGDSYRLWEGTIQRNFRLIDNTLQGASIYGELYTTASDAVSLSLLAAGTPVLVPFAHTSATAFHTAASSNGVKITVAGPVFVEAHVAFFGPDAGPTNVLYQLYQNSTPLPDAIVQKKSTIAANDSTSVAALATAVANDVFYLYAYSSGAGSTVPLAITNGTLIVQNAGARQGPPGPVGPGGGGAIGGGACGAPVSGAITLPNVAGVGTSGCIAVDLTSIDATVNVGSVTPSDGLAYQFDLQAGTKSILFSGGTFISVANGSTTPEASMAVQGGGQSVVVKYNAANSWWTTP